MFASVCGGVQFTSTFVEKLQRLAFFVMIQTNSANLFEYLQNM